MNMLVNKASFEQPLKAAVIRDKLGLSKRDLEFLIEDLRKAGHPIVARKHKVCGYYIPKTEEERLLGTAPYRKQIQTEQRNLAIVMSVDLASYWTEACS